MEIIPAQSCEGPPAESPFFDHLTADRSRKTRSNTKHQGSAKGFLSTSRRDSRSSVQVRFGPASSLEFSW